MFYRFRFAKVGLGMSDKQDSRFKMRTVVVIVGFVFLFWLASYPILWWVFPDWPTRGTFGDMFGAVNALFSGLALGGIIIAIILQSQELTLQRQELRRTAAAQEEAGVALKEQMRTLRLSAQIQAAAAVSSGYHALVFEPSGLGRGDKLSRAREWLARLESLLDEAAET